MRRISRGQNRSPGQVTVFLSLIVVLIFSVIFTLLESARSQGLRMRLQLAVNAGISSVFAMYDLPLFEKYGLLLFADRYGYGMELEEIFCDYAGRNAGASDLPGTDWLALTNIQPTKLEYILATDSHGEAFTDMVATYMKEAGLAEQLISLIEEEESLSEQLSALDITEESGEEDLQSLMDKSKSVAESIQSSQQDTGEEGDSSGLSDMSEYTEQDRQEAEELYGNLTDILKSYINKGLLALVWDGADISAAHRDMTDYPSKAGDSFRERTGLCTYDLSAADRVLLREFVLSRLGNCRDTDGESAEVEYVISGKDNNRDNVAHCVKLLLTLRSGLNYIYLNENGKYSQEAYTVALLVAGWTGIEALVKGVQEVILGIWSLAEAVMDVRNLMKGNKVPLFKGDGDWNLSLEGVAAGEETGCSSESGLDYAGYLRILLYFTGTENIAYRTMDVIQENVREIEPDFYMKNCIYGAKIQATGETEDIFPYLPAGLDFYISADSAFSYGALPDC